MNAPRQGVNESMDIPRPLPRSLLTQDQLDVAFSNVSERITLGEPILRESATLARLPGLEGIELECPIEWITPNPAQPRKNFDQAKLEDLGARIKESGQRVAIQVVPYLDGEKIGFFIIDGERRYRASQIIDNKSVRMIVEWQDSIEKIFDASLTANLDREGHNAIELAQAYQIMIGFLERNPDREDKRNPVQIVAEKYGKTPTTIYNYLKLLELPEEIQQLIIEGKITVTGAFSMERGRLHDRRLRDRDMEGVRMRTTAHLLMKRIAECEAGASGDDAGNKSGKKGRRSGRITEDTLREAMDTAILETQGEDVMSRISLTRALLKVSGALRVLGKYLPEVVDDKNGAVIRDVARQMGTRSIPEVIASTSQSVRDQLGALIETMSLATKPEPLEKSPNQPSFIDYVTDKLQAFGSDNTLISMAKELASATDRGDVITMAELSEKVLADKNVVTGNFVSKLKPALAKINLFVEEHSVRRQTQKGDWEKVPAYRLNWIVKPAAKPLSIPASALVNTPVVPTTLEVARNIVPYVIPPVEGTIDEDVQKMIVADWVGVIQSRKTDLPLNPVCGDKLVIKLRMHQKTERGTIIVATNIKGFVLNFSTYVPELLRKHRKYNPKFPKSMLLQEIRTSEDLV